MTERMVSFAQNGEDVVLARALGHVVNGVYLDIGANDPSLFSVTRAFYDRGWRGLCVEPNPRLAQKFQDARPEDVVLEGVISDSDTEAVTFHLIGDTGLSTLVDDIASTHSDSGWEVEDIVVPSYTIGRALDESGIDADPIHFAVIDTEGAELQVLRSFDFTRVRPWVLVVEATAPLTTRPVHGTWEQLLLDAGYVFCLFDGLSRFYVDARAHADLVPSLTYPAGVFDDFIPVAEKEREARHREEIDERDARIDFLTRQVEDITHTVSWKVTAPLRAVRRATRDQDAPVVD